MKHVIIGNGILATTIAFRLLQKSPHDEIIIVGPKSRMGGATAAAGAMLNSFAEIDQYSLRSKESIAHFEASYLATQIWPKFERELIDAAGMNLPNDCKNCQVHTGGCYSTGTYIVNNTSSDQMDDDNFNSIVKALDDFNEQYNFVDPREIPNYEPATRSRALRAIYIPSEGWLNPKIVLEKLDNILFANPRVEIIDSEVKSFNYSNNLVTDITTFDGKVICGDSFTLANGYGATKLLDTSAPELEIQPIFSGVGVSIEIKTDGFPHKNVVRTPNRGGACGIYSVPYFKGPNQSDCHILIGASNFISTTPKFNARITSVAHLLDSAIREINQNFYNAELICINVGNRPTPLDQYPLLGEAVFSNLFMANGTKRDGFHLSPIISDYLASIILKKKPLLDLKIFSPTRKPIRDLERSSAIEQNIQSLMSEQFQHGFVPSNIKQVGQLVSDWKGQVVKIHDENGAIDWGIPPLMLKLYRDQLIPKRWLQP